MKIELATFDHQKSIIDFQIKMALETENLQLDPDIVQKGVKAVFDDPTKGKYLVAIDKEQVIASLLIIPEWSDWRNGFVDWIHSLYVVPEYRGQKIFKQMYQHLQEIVENDKSIRGLRLYVDKTNIKAQKVYEALGMTKEHYDLYEWMP